MLATVLAAGFAGVVMWSSDRPANGPFSSAGGFIETPPVGFSGIDCGEDPDPAGAVVAGDYVNPSVRACFLDAYVDGKVAEMRTFDGSVWRVSGPESVSIWWPGEKADFSLMYRWRTLHGCKIERTSGFVDIWVLSRNGAYQCTSGVRVEDTAVDGSSICAGDTCPRSDWDDFPDYGLCSQGPIFRTPLLRYDEGNVFAAGATITADPESVDPTGTGTVVTMEDDTIVLPDTWRATTGFVFDSVEQFSFRVVAPRAPVSTLITFRLTGSDGQTSTISREILNTLPEFGQCEWGSHNQ